MGANPRRAARSTVVSSWLRLFRETREKKHEADVKKLLPTLDIGSHINASLQLLPKAPGSQGMLPSPSPLRTVHESRPSHGSSPCCFVSMALVVRMVTPLMHKHAVFLAIFPTLLFGFDVVIVDRIAVIKERFAQTTTKVLRLE